jgi:hypothetical protein
MGPNRKEDVHLENIRRKPKAVKATGINLSAVTSAITASVLLITAVAILIFLDLKPVRAYFKAQE